MSRPLRVAHVVATSGATGVEAHLIALLAAFDRREVEPTLFAPGPGPLVDRLRTRGVAVEFGAPTRKLAFAEADRLADRWKEAFDVVHAHGPRAAFWAARAARQAGIPMFVVTIHEVRWLTLPPGPKRSLWVALEEHSLTRADHLIAVSEDTRREWTRQRPELARRMSVVHGSTPMLLEPERLPRARPGGRDDGVLRLVTVGRFNREKGYERLLDAVSRLLAAGRDCRLTAVGSGPVPRELSARATGLGLAERIVWESDAPDIPSLLAQADCFVTGTRAETFGIAVLEAMAVGLPVVAPAVGGLREVVSDGETGVLVPPDPEATLSDRIARTIGVLADDPARAARLGEAGARRARECFSPPRLASSVTRIYRSEELREGVARD